MTVEQWLGVIGLIVSAVIGVIRVIQGRRRRRNGTPEVLLDATRKPNGKPDRPSGG